MQTQNTPRFLGDEHIVILRTEEIESSPYELGQVINLLQMGVLLDGDFYMVANKADWVRSLIEE